MDGIRALKNKFMDDFTCCRNSIVFSADEKYIFERDGWETFYFAIEECLSAYRQQWFNEFVSLVCQILNRDKAVFSKIPTKAEAAIKAFQFVHVVMHLWGLKLIEVNQFREFVWQYFKATSPQDAFVCRGYFARYESCEHLLENFSSDICSHFLESGFHSLLEKNKSVHDKAGQLGIMSIQFAFRILGISKDTVEANLK